MGESTIVHFAGKEQLVAAATVSCRIRVLALAVSYPYAYIYIYGQVGSGNLKVR